jgi:hypothetical protein
MVCHACHVEIHPWMKPKGDMSLKQTRLYNQSRPCWATAKTGLGSVSGAG